MKFRTAVGLRSDEAWVREVAANPASKAGSEAYEIPLLPDEVRFLQGRNGRIEDARAFGEMYGALFPNGFAGAAIDGKDGDRLVLLYTKDVEIHQIRLTVMAAATRPEVRAATWTLDELTKFQALVNADRTRDPQIKVFGAEIDILENKIRINYMANTHALGDTLLARFNSTGWLVPRWFGRLDPWDGPVGAIQVKVVDADGVPRFDLPCRYLSLDPDIGYDGGGDTNSLGECFFDNLPVGPYRVRVLARDEQVERLLKSVDTTVTEGETQLLRVVVPDT